MLLYGIFVHNTNLYVQHCTVFVQLHGLPLERGSQAVVPQYPAANHLQTIHHATTLRWQ